MGKRGPAPKPSHLKVVEGTYRKDRAPANEPKPAAAVPSCPSWLGAEAKREWKRVVGELAALGLVSEVDRAALAGYCEAYQMWYDARKALDAAGSLVQSTPNGYEQQRPEVGIINTALKTMRVYLAEFGMTPAARTRISVEAPKDEGSPWERFKKRSG